MTAIRKCPAAFVETDIDDERILISLDSGEFFSLQGTGLAFWQAVDGMRDVAAIITALAAEYGVSAARITADCEGFLEQLRNFGFVEIDRAGG